MNFLIFFILKSISNFMLSCVEHEKKFYNLGPSSGIAYISYIGIQSYVGTTLFLDRLKTQYQVPILLPVSDNCPSEINRGGGNYRIRFRIITKHP